MVLSRQKNGFDEPPSTQRDSALFAVLKKRRAKTARQRGNRIYVGYSIDTLKALMTPGDALLLVMRRNQVPLASEPLFPAKAESGCSGLYTPANGADSLVMSSSASSLRMVRNP